VLLSGVASGGFLPPEAVTDGAGQDQLARNPTKAIAIDVDGRLHLAYWRGGSVTTVAEPSYVLYRGWSVGSGWSAEEIVDDSFIGPDRLGGRSPSLAIDARGDLWLAWHDHRHSTALQGYIDNLEIYADVRLSSGGGFSSIDLRLTTTAAGGAGDNGYLPMLAPHVDGSLSVAWYDFTADAAVSDIYLKQSDASGAFNLAEPVSSLRVTNKDDRGGSPAFTVADLSVDATGTRHLAWATGTSAAGADIYYASASTGSVAASPQAISTGTSSFFDTPRVLAAATGDVWIYWSDSSNASDKEIRLRRLRAGEATFDAVTTPEPAAGSQVQPALAIGAAGDMHFAWIDEPTNRVVYRHYPSPGAPADGTETIAAGTGPLQRIAMTLNADGRPHLVIEESLGFTARRLWHARPTDAEMGVDGWNLYK